MAGSSIGCWGGNPRDGKISDLEVTTKDPVTVGDTMQLKGEAKDAPGWNFKNETKEYMTGNPAGAFKNAGGKDKDY